MQSDARTLIAVRVVVVTTLLLASLIIQYTVHELLPINYMYLTAGLAYTLTLVYILALQLIASRKINLMLQTGGDLLVAVVVPQLRMGARDRISFVHQGANELLRIGARQQQRDQLAREHRRGLRHYHRGGRPRQRPASGSIRVTFVHDLILTRRERRGF